MHNPIIKGTGKLLVSIIYEYVKHTPYTYMYFALMHRDRFHALIIQSLYKTNHVKKPCPAPEDTLPPHSTIYSYCAVVMTKLISI